MNENSGTITLDTSSLSGSGDYILRNESSFYLNADGEWDSSLNNASQAEVIEQDLNVDFEDDEVDNTVSDNPTDINVDTIRQTSYVNVTGDVGGNDLDVSDLEDIFNGDGNTYTVNNSDNDDDLIQIRADDGDGSIKANFTDVDAGEYNFNFEVNDTEVADNASITVNDPGDADVSVEDATVTQGGIAEITVSQSAASSGTVVIGNEDDSGYQANVSITDFDDEEEFTLYFNTYAAGNATYGPAAWVDSDDTDVTVSIDSKNDQTNLTDILATGDYEITASSFTTAGSSGDYQNQFDRTQDQPDDVSTLFIEERADPSVNLWTASSDNVDTVFEESETDEQLAVIDSAIENDQITETDSVAHEDFLVTQISAPGFEGLFEWTADDGVSAREDQFIALVNGSTYQNADGDGAIQFQVEETGDSVSANAEPLSLDLEETDSQNDDSVRVLYDEEDEQYFVLIKTDDMKFDNIDRNDVEVNEDEDYEMDIQFQARDDRLLGYDSDDHDDVSELYDPINTQFDLVERSGEFDLTNDEQIQVEAAEDQDITGTTNVAPGSEIRVRLRGDGDARFSKSLSDVVVQPDGTFTATFDFSDRNVDDEFTATLGDVVTLSGEDDPEADGLVVEQVVEEPEDGEEAPEEGNESDGDMTDDGNETDEGSSDEGSSDEGSSDEGSTDGGEDGGDTSEQTPGFGAIVALVAVLGAALLASRRQN